MICLSVAGIHLSADQVVAIAASVAAVIAGMSAAIAFRSSRRTVEALELPFLIPDPGIRDQFRLRFEDGDPQRLRMPLRNAGMGPAMLGDVQFIVDGKQILAPAGGQIAFPPGDCQSLPLQLESHKPGAEEVGELRIYYTHASGAKYMTQCQVKTETDAILPTGFRRRRSDRRERPFLFWPSRRRWGSRT